MARVTDRRLLLGALLLAAAWTALGLHVERGGTVLGTATPPFVMGWSPRGNPWIAGAVAAAGAFVAAAPALLRAPRWVYLSATAGLALALALTIGAARIGAHGWSAIFDDSFEAKNEYLPGLPALSYGRGFFLDHFAELVPAVPVNVAGHPPGLMLVLDATGVTTAGRLAALCIGAAVAIPALTYALALGLAGEARPAPVRTGEGSVQRWAARRAGARAGQARMAAPGGSVGDAAGLGPLSVRVVQDTDEVLEATRPASVPVAGPRRSRPADPEGTARIAGLLAAASPAVLLFGVTSADAVYAALGTAAAALLVRRSWAARSAGAGVLGLGALCSWALPAVGAFAALVAWRRSGWRDALALAVLSAIPFLALNAVLAGAYGYDPIGTLRATEAVYRRSLAEVRPYWFWSVGSPVAWAVSAGLPITGAWLIAVRRRDVAALALAVVVLVASGAGFTKAETERIWLMFVPLACVAAATVVGPRAVRPVLLALVLQALVVQVLFETVW
ncbi:MAG: methylthioxylose transferase [Baekduia sp.]|nr:methylthioxylose transferase [Baekduia sp.]